MIRVGGATEIEVKEKKDRVDDALHATRAAVEEGIVPGGGVALLRAGKALDRRQARQRRPAHRHRDRPPRAPAAGAPDRRERRRRRLGRRRQARSTTRTTPSATTRRPDEYGDLFKLGIIDPTKVVRTALQGAASVAGLLITTEAMVAEKPKKESPRPAMPAAAWTTEAASRPRFKRATSPSPDDSARRKRRAFFIQLSPLDRLQPPRLRVIISPRGRP